MSKICLFTNLDNNKNIISATTKYNANYFTLQLQRTLYQFDFTSSRLLRCLIYLLLANMYIKVQIQNKNGLSHC